MAKALVEVEIPEGWEAVKYDHPGLGDYYIHDRLNAVARVGYPGDMEPAQYWTPTNSESLKLPRIILRPAWTWPAWLKAPWIAMEKDGEWIAFNYEPIANAHYWGHSINQKGQCSQGLHPSLCDFTGPPCTNWRESKRKNPNL
jgi:hypothetical protein